MPTLQPNQQGWRCGSFPHLGLTSYTPLTQPSLPTSHFPAIVCSHSTPIILCLYIILAT